MRHFDYFVLDVFTDQVFGGNPLAVLPDARGLNTGEMQRIAREFNFSETAFVLPPESDDATARLRIFDPKNELPFAGHPTVGTAICLAQQGSVFGQSISDYLVLDENVGPIECAVANEDDLWSASFTTLAPFEYLDELPVDLVGKCLGLPTSTVRTDGHAPIIVSKGLPFCVIELDSEADLARIRIDQQALRDAQRRFGPDEEPLALYVYSNQGDGGIAARMFAPFSGIPEDPATGSAAAALAALLCDVTEAPVDLEIRQGAQMGRPSTIFAYAETQEGGVSLVSISGTAVTVMQGRMTLPETG
ncbi:PhzF family phenazine biosynthesis protein [Qingshengfaniella alkalisoli]|uniref:PhzF family phenazine biosynthesis protein n=1 Tax=Qingshengfaniella alkalisoli TaxID=2599296 RepID=A0A5B8I7Z7_9RHOB|nr:PhzF family phenazine biosynthesis protein [Qingshengfaniella alkalisoli]QDY68696.1 PhzF family phenazine biosynthesis protein [Qingshengfaniella alkalisoli]